MAATVDLEELVPDLQAELNVPGTDSFPDATTGEWTAQLRNAFWEVVLDGLISSYEEVDGIVSPTSGTTPLSREMQQLVVFFAGVRVVRIQLRELKTQFRAKAGPVEYETQQSAQVLKTLLDELTRRRNFILNRLSDSGSSSAYYIDLVSERDRSLNEGLISWWGN